MLAREQWVRVAELTAGERSGLFAMEDALYGCYLRVGDPGSRGRIPGRTSPTSRCRQVSRAPPPSRRPTRRRRCTGTRGPRVNLTPIAGLERHLYPRHGDVRLALRAVREVVLERNREGRTA